MYNLVYAFFAIVLLGCSKNKLLHHLLMLFLAFLFSTRGMDVPDTEGYMRRYDEVFLYFANENIELGLTTLCFISNNLIGLSFSTFLFIVTLLLMELWYFVSCKLFPNSQVGMLFLLFMSFFGFFYLGIVFANGIALIICYAAFAILQTKKRNALFYCCGLLILATLFHKSSVLFFVIIPLMRVKLSNGRIMFWFIFSLFLLVTSNISIINNVLTALQNYSEDFNEYNNYESEKAGKLFNITFLMEFVITILAIYSRSKIRKDIRDKYDMYLKLVLVGFTIYCIFWTYNGVTRISGLFYFYSSIIIYMHIYENSRIRNRVTKNFIAVIASILLFVVLIYSQSGLLYY